MASADTAFWGTDRELLPGPHFGHVKGVEAELLGICILRLHNLHLGRPFDLFTSLDGLPQIPLREVGVLARDTVGFSRGILLLAVLGDEVILDIHELALLVDPALLVSVEQATELTCFYMRLAI